MCVCVPRENIQHQSQRGDLANGTGYWAYGIACKDQCECEFRTATDAVIPFTLHPLLTTDVGLDLCTLRPDRCILCPDLCTLSLWCYPSINQCKYSSAQIVVVTGCNLRWLCLSFSHWCKHSLRWWWCHLLQLALVVFFLPPTGAHTLLALEQLALCGGGLWWWYMYKL